MLQTFLGGPIVCSALIATNPTFFLFPGLLNCRLNFFYNSVSSNLFLFQFSFLKPFFLYNSASCFSLPPVYAPQILFNSITDLLFNRSNLIFTNSLSEPGLFIYFLSGPIFFLPADSMLLSAILQEPCYCLPSFLFCFSTSTHDALFCPSPPQFL